MRKIGVGLSKGVNSGGIRETYVLIPSLTQN